ncbi:hypothetical protein NMG60_11035619 [Bertholletia excelsa]
MEFQRSLYFLLVVVTCLLCSSEAYNFYVGGKDGWVLKPSEKYSHWAERNRFQVNDSLIFKYKKGSDSVLVVNQEDYNNCNKAKPIQALSDGNSVFKFHASGPFFFISGEGDKCEKGQKLIVVVLAVRHHHTRKAPASSPSPSPYAAMSPENSTPNNSPDSEAPAPASSAATGLRGALAFAMGSCVVLCLSFGLVI